VPERVSEYRRIAVLGGVYANAEALAAVLADARRRNAEAVFCLGDLGGFGPDPAGVLPLLRAHDVRVVRGNYDDAIATGATDCNCGYTDPRDNHYARLSYAYTVAHTPAADRAWLATLPAQRRVQLGSHRVLMCHGSPRRINEFLFRSTSPVPFLEVLLDQNRCDAVLCTHTGLHWHRRLPSGRDVVNVGVIGRPANDGDTRVWYALLDVREERDGGLNVELVPLVYDHQALAAAMRRERLPEEFVETILTGWWTTCLEILPARERAASRY
jgi:diadenosine tetraphosphatase ApaH/serine/threonine PP2A family protein phosphatase